MTRPFRSHLLILTIELLLIPVAAMPSLLAQNVQRGEMEEILKIVAGDVQKNFYDPNLKGLDWPALTEETRQRIQSSDNMGQMIMAICSLVARLQDSHTYFIPPLLTQQSDFGFGARAYGDKVLVSEVSKKGPAEKAGLAVGDQIVALNRIETNRENITEILRLLSRFVPSSSVDLSVISADGAKRTIHVPAHMVLMQEHQYIESVWRVADAQRARDVHVSYTHKDLGSGIAYLSVPSFHDRPELAYAAINKVQHSSFLILDVRGNGGGWRDTLLEFLGFFSDKAQLLAHKVQRSGSEDLVVKPKSSGFNGGIVVLVDSYCASAAELAARYLQLERKAVVIRDRTSGQVNEGDIIPGKIGAGFIMPFATVVTDAKLVMPDGEELEGHGVIPDTQCIPTPDDLRSHRDPCFDQAVELAKKWLGSAPTPAK